MISFNSSSYIINVLFQGISRTFTFIANFFIFVIIARLSKSEIFGQYSLILAYLSVFAVLSDFGMTSILSKDFNQKNNNNLYLGNYYCLKIFINIILIVISFILAFFAFKDIFLILLFSSFFIPMIGSRFFEPLFQILRKPFYSLYPSVLYSISYFLFSILFLIYFNNQNILFNLIFSYCLANALYFILAVFLSYRLIIPEFQIDIEIIKKIFFLSLPLGISSFLTIFNTRIPFFFLSSLSSDHAVGIYSSAFRFLELGSMFIVMLTSPLLPVLSDKKNKNSKEFKYIVIKIFEGIAIIILPLIILAPVISPYIIDKLFGVDFIESVMALNILACSFVIIINSLFFTMVGISLNVIKVTYFITGSATVINFILNYLLISHFSFIGAAISNLIIELYMLGWILFFLIKKNGNIFRLKMWIKIIISNIIFIITIFLLKDIGLFLLIIIYFIIVLLVYRTMGFAKSIYFLKKTIFSKLNLN